MTIKTYEYNPDYAVPPGWVLEDRLATQNISHAEFARRCGRSPKLISEIISGKAPIEPRTAIQFESVLGVDAGIWLGIEKDYRLHLEREAETRRAEESIAWAKRFPIAELVKRGVFEQPKSNADKVKTVLSFFGVASVDAWHIQQKSMRVAYRHSPTFKSGEEALATWLRLGEMEAGLVDCPDYSEAGFKNALSQIRDLTAAKTAESILQAQMLCRESGVVLAIVKPLPKTALSGATRWINPRKALIQLSARHLSDDHLWFSFFHEAAHILLHSKRDVFVHESKGEATEADIEADEWASDFLISPAAWGQFEGCGVFTKRIIVDFAYEQGIAPGIVVGRLQHEGLISWRSRLNSLKTPLAWSEDTKS
ncbi:MAG: ImmA/IrrE family metallo-endopeptidase [Chloroflexota bacterium]|nr:ImmA/IrrE family metallo-endopeptidase [Chloroflexota bacterium]